MSLLAIQSRGSLGNFAQATTIIPINDLKGSKSSRFVEGEQLVRCKLASLYRLVDILGWSHGIYNHISARIDSENEHFLINPFGMLYSEITASSLLKIDLNGDIVDHGTSQFGVNKAGFTLHSAIHAARPDIKCIIHLHTPAAVAVSAMKCGLLPLCQEAIICGEVSYHDYHGIFVEEQEKATLVQNLGPSNKILILHNHGITVCGQTIEDTFHRTFTVLTACESQVRAISYGKDNLVMASEEAKSQANQVASMGAGGLDASGKGWKPGHLEFEALMRTLDNLGYRTGYDYKLMPLKTMTS